MSDQPHPAALSVDELRRQCAVGRVRRSGPGGQHRNKVETGVVVRHEPTGVRAEASERRSQAENLAEAWRRLRVRLALEVRRPPLSCEPSELWQSRVEAAGIAVNLRHDDYPALLAEALDVLTSAGWDIAAAAERLQVTRSQLTKFLRREPEAFAQLHAERAARGLKRLT